MKKLIIVTGMHRSGTSMLAGCLSACGVKFCGELIPADSDNLKGYWEHKEIVAIHAELLIRLGSSWHDTTSLPKNWENTPYAKQAEQKLSAILTADFDWSQVCGVKDPRICIFWPLWLRILERLGIDFGVAAIFRNPHETANSISKRDGREKDSGLALWYYYNIENITALIKANSPIKCLSYNEVLEDPVASCFSILTTLDETDLAKKINPDLLRDCCDVRLHHNIESSKPNDFYFRLYQLLINADKKASHRKILFYAQALPLLKRRYSTLSLQVFVANSPSFTETQSVRVNCMVGELVTLKFSTLSKFVETGPIHLRIDPCEQAGPIITITKVAVAFSLDGATTSSVRALDLGSELKPTRDLIKHEALCDSYIATGADPQIVLPVFQWAGQSSWSLEISCLINLEPGTMAEIIKAKDDQNSTALARARARDKTIAELQTSLAECDAKIASATQALGEQETSAVTFSKSLSEIGSNLANLTVSMKERDSTLCILHQTIAQRDASIKDLSHSLSALNNEIGTRDSTIGSLHTIVKERNDALAQSQEQISKRDASLAFSIQTIEQRDALLRDVTASLSSLNGELTNRDTSIAILNTAVKNRDETIAHTQKLFAERDAAISVSSQTIEQRDTSIKNLSTTLLALNAELSTRDETIQRRNAALVSAQETISQRDTSLADSKAQIARRDITIANSLATIDQRDASIRDLTALVSSLNIEVANRDIAVASLLSTVKDRDTALKSTQEVISLRDYALATSIQTIDQRDASIKDLTETLSSLNAEIKNRDGFIAFLNVSLQEQRASAEELGKELQTQNTIIEALKAISIERESAIQRLDVNVSDLNQTITSLMTSLSERTALVQTLEQDVALKSDKIIRIQNSTSWKATAPLRSVRRLFEKTQQQSAS